MDVFAFSVKYPQYYTLFLYLFIFTILLLLTTKIIIMANEKIIIDIEKVKDELTNCHGYDFDSDWWGDESLTMIEEIITACESVGKIDDESIEPFKCNDCGKLTWSAAWVKRGQCANCGAFKN